MPFPPAKDFPYALKRCVRTFAASTTSDPNMLSQDEASAAAAVYSIMEQMVNQRIQSLRNDINQQLPKLVKKFLDEAKNT